jgi:hypothetical protein
MKISNVSANTPIAIFSVNIFVVGGERGVETFM